MPETTDGKIFVYDIKTSEIRRSNINNVAVERYTYDISERSEADELLCKAFLNYWFYKNALPIDANQFVFADGNTEKDFIENQYISKVECEGLRYLDKLRNGDFPYSGESKLQQNIKLFERNLMTTLLTGKSTLSEQEIDCIVSQSQELSKTKDERLSFFEFFANQFLRTIRGREAVLDAIESTKKRFPEKELYQRTTKCLFPLMMCANTLIMAYSLWKGDFYLEILLNETAKNFITSDEPIINLCVDYLNLLTEEVSEMDLYYPVTPKIALLCKHGGSKNMKRAIKEADEVDMLNSKMFQGASRQVFSLCEDDFQKIPK